MENRNCDTLGYLVEISKERFEGLDWFLLAAYRKVIKEEDKWKKHLSKIKENRT